ncbi:serine/threonine-protein kinase [Anaeromyxobacter oryzisoli]|uniref:serine/threonine-protein kinase n=1 Tax=Anaeromyxobacter oryzisoli TaxID=2925408 RepID=UPI001F57C3FC|nr:serine/threonine-protein kinase [Anaeromyxobacter sp. SG63]
MRLQGARPLVRNDLSRYSLEALIGKGGMAEVYRAVVRAGPDAGRTVAVKRLKPDLARDAAYVALFEREAETTRRLRHPAIVEVLETGFAGDTPFIVMEYVDGRNLKQILAQCAARGILLPVDFAAYVAHVLATALAYAHAGRDAAGAPLRLVHCDVSPSNVFISRLGEIKLGDFGVAVAGGAAASPGGALGKIHYLAPEQIRGERPTTASDIFALGAVLFELLTNAPAFPGADVNAVGQKILGGVLRAPSQLRPELPFELDALVLRCLAKDPSWRFPTAEALAAEIATRYDPSIGTPLAIAAVVRGLFGAG